MAAAVRPVAWGVERPIHDGVTTGSQMIDLIHDMLARYEEAVTEQGYVKAPGPVMAIAYRNAAGQRIARVEGPVLPVNPVDDVVPL